MKFLYLLLCLPILINVVLSISADRAGSSSKKHSNVVIVSPEVKYQQIKDMALKSKGRVITLDDSTYNYYALTKPRPYSLIVLLTAAHPKFKCGICKQLDNEMILLASAYFNKLQQNQEDPKVFFIRLDYESSQKIFQSYEVSSVPLVFHIPAYLGADRSAKEYYIGPRDRFQVQADVSAENIAAFMNERTNVSVEIKRSMLWSYVALIVLFGILAALVQPVINSLPFWIRIIQMKNIWALVSAGVYTCAISGLIFDIIRSPQMYYANPQTGQIMFFYPQSGNQFVVEGFVIGFLNLGCAASLIFLTAFAPYFKDESNRKIGVVAGLITFAVCFRMVKNLYIMKNNWYGGRY